MEAKLSCTACGAEIPDPGCSECPACQSVDRSIHLGDSAAGAETRVRRSAHYGQRGKVSAHKITTVDTVPIHDRGGRIEERRIEIDHVDNWYSQTTRNPETREITFTKGGALDDPSVHGDSARRGRRET